MINVIYLIVESKLILSKGKIIMTINILEMQLVAVWRFTKSPEGCVATIETLIDLARDADSSEEKNTLLDAMNLALAKGNLLMLERQA